MSGAMLGVGGIQLSSTSDDQHPKGFHIGCIGMHLFKHVSYVARENLDFH